MVSLEGRCNDDDDDDDKAEPGRNVNKCQNGNCYGLAVSQKQKRKKKPECTTMRMGVQETAQQQLSESESNSPPNGHSMGPGGGQARGPFLGYASSLFCTPVRSMISHVCLTGHIK